MNLEYQNLLVRKTQIEKELGQEFDKRSTQFLKDGQCHVCGKPIINHNKSIWCHRWDCKLEEEDVCACGLEAHPECCSIEKCFNYPACPAFEKVKPA